MMLWPSLVLIYLTLLQIRCVFVWVSLFFFLPTFDPVHLPLPHFVLECLRLLTLCFASILWPEWLPEKLVLFFFPNQQSKLPDFCFPLIFQQTHARPPIKNNFCVCPVNCILLLCSKPIKPIFEFLSKFPLFLKQKLLRIQNSALRVRTQEFLPELKPAGLWSRDAAPSSLVGWSASSDRAPPEAPEFIHFEAAEEVSLFSRGGESKIVKDLS